MKVTDPTPAPPLEGRGVPCGLNYGGSNSPPFKGRGRGGVCNLQIGVQQIGHPSSEVRAGLSLDHDLEPSARAHCRSEVRALLSIRSLNHDLADGTVVHADDVQPTLHGVLLPSLQVVNLIHSVIGHWILVIVQIVLNASGAFLSFYNLLE